MDALAPLAGLLLLVAGGYWLGRMVRHNPPSAPDEAVGELFRGPPLSVSIAVLAIAVGAVLIIASFIR
jgi:hypothetical protein